MSDDSISRQAAIDEIKEIYQWHDNVTEARIIGHFKRMPSTQSEPQWIPCSERLPEEYGNYLITTYDGNVDIGTIDPKGKSVWSACDANGFYWIRNVIAWKPLPDPWRGAER